MNRSFAAVYDGQYSPDAAKDAAERLHLILQREDAVVAKNSGTIAHVITNYMSCFQNHTCIVGVGDLVLGAAYNHCFLS